MSNKREPILLLTDARGVYLPKDFIEAIRPECLSEVSDEDKAVLLAGPEHEHYWEVWSDVCDDAVVTEAPGTPVAVKFTLYQDGDLWLIPEGMEWSERRDWFAWPEVCEECDESIPDVEAGTMANKHHKDSCSLYDPEKE